MPTMYRLQKEDLERIVKLLKPELSDDFGTRHDADKLKVLISEWLLLNDFSTLHQFEKDGNDAWIHPRENQCDCCWRFRVGRRKLSIPKIDDNNPSPRESQMLYYGGPWVVASENSVPGKPKMRVRSHLLHTTTTYENEHPKHRSEAKCCSFKQFKNSLLACLCFECCRIN